MNCNSCVKKHSSEWVLSKELAKKNRRLCAFLVAVLFLWVFTICAFLSYISNNVNVADDNDMKVFVPEIVVEGVDTTDGTVSATRKRKIK